MSQHGTAFDYSLGQFVEAKYAFEKSLTKVLPGFDPKDLLKVLGEKSEELDTILRSGIGTLLGVNSIPAPAAATAAQSEPLVFPTFLAGRIGIYKTVEAVQAAFTEKGCQISTYSGQLMSKPAFVLSQEEQDMEWVAVSGRQLGFTESYTRVALIDRAEKKFRLDRCQPEDGVYIRLGYLKQPKGEWRPLAMDPISASDGNLNIFDVKHDDDGLYLRAHYDDADYQWYPDDVWLFRRRQSFRFSPYPPFGGRGEFCLVSCPFQPPSILPTSSISTDRAIYFLLSSDLVSHNTISRILRVSTFRIARRT
jgi:hypothetical protein